PAPRASRPSGATPRRAAQPPPPDSSSGPPPRISISLDITRSNAGPSARLPAGAHPQGIGPRAHPGVEGTKAEAGAALRVNPIPTGFCSAGQEATWSAGVIDRSWRLSYFAASRRGVKLPEGP